MSLKSVSAPLPRVAQGSVSNSSENQFCHLQSRGSTIHLADQEANTIHM